MASRRSLFAALATMLVAPAAIQAQTLEQVLPNLLQQILGQNGSDDRRDDNRYDNRDDNHDNGRGHARGRRRRCWWQDQRVGYRDYYGRWRYRMARRQVCR